MICNTHQNENWETDELGIFWGTLQFATKILALNAMSKKSKYFILINYSNRQYTKKYSYLLYREANRMVEVACPYCAPIHF